MAGALQYCRYLPPVDQGWARPLVGTGGSGGGGGAYVVSYVPCNANPYAYGGMEGNNGKNCETSAGGVGQDNTNWKAAVSLLKYRTFSAGAGGAPGHGDGPGVWYTTGGGGGGLLVNGQGPSGGNGAGTSFHGNGGQGYGAGAGAGGRNGDGSTGSAGTGAAGLVYIEWGF